MGKTRRDWQDGFLKASTLPFDEWVDCLQQEIAEINWCDDPLDLLRRVRRFFESSELLFTRFGPEKLNRLLWSFLSESGLLQVLFDESLDLQERIACLWAIKTLYMELFFPHATRVLLHGSNSQRSEISPLNSICYMWWDIFPSWGTGDPSNRIDAEILKLLADLLRIDHPACRESALHGLGHWHLHYPAQVESIIDAFLSEHGELDQELLDYACMARCGCVN